MKRRMFLVAAVLLAFAAPAAAAGNWRTIATDIAAELDGALKHYGEGDAGAAEEKVTDAYFAIFEGEKANMEIAVRKSLSLKRAVELERGFSGVRKAMHERRPLKEVRATARALSEEIKKAAEDLDKKRVRTDAFRTVN